MTIIAVSVTNSLVIDELLLYVLCVSKIKPLYVFITQ